MDDLASLHEAEYGEKPHCVASAPGVVNVMGAHTEQTDGYLLLLGSSSRARVAASPRSDGSMRFYAADTGERKRTSASALKYRHEDRFSGTAKGVLSRLQTLGARLSGINVTVASEIPSGVGFGASQAIAVALAAALAQIFHFRLNPVEAAQVAYYVEHTILELQVGFATFLGACVARPGHLLFVDTHRLDWKHLRAELNGAALYGVNTNAPAALTVEEELRRQRECIECLEELAGRRNGCSFQEFTAAELAASIGRVPETARHYCLHIVGENQRVLDSVAAVRRADIRGIGRLLSESHQSLRDLYEATSPEVDWFVKHVQTLPGVYGARLAGGSAGTCALVLAENGSDARMAAMLREYERIFGFHPVVVPCTPDGGVRFDYREGT